MPIFMAKKSVGLGCFGIVGVPQTIVDRNGSFQLCERCAQDLPGEIGQCRGVLGKTATRIASLSIIAGHLHMCGAHAWICGHYLCKFVEVATTCFDKSIIQLVEECDLGGQETVDAVFDQAGRDKIRVI